MYKEQKIWINVNALGSHTNIDICYDLWNIQLFVIILGPIEMKGTSHNFLKFC